MNEEETEGPICAESVPEGGRAMKIEKGIGWVPDEKTPGNLRSAYDRDYVDEIARLRAERNLLREMFNSAERELAAERAARVAVASPVREEGEL